MFETVLDIIFCLWYDTNSVLFCVFRALCFVTCVWRNRSLNVLGWTRDRDNTPLLSLSEYMGPGNRLPWLSREPMTCEVCGLCPRFAADWTRKKSQSGFVVIFFVGKKKFIKYHGKSTRKCGVLPGDTQLATQGHMGNIGHVTCQFRGFSGHLGAPNGLNGQCDGRF